MHPSGEGAVGVLRERQGVVVPRTREGERLDREDDFSSEVLEPTLRRA
jgi:hypothetical protein